MAKYRYTIILDREGDDDYGADAYPESGHDGSDADAIRQVAAEIQEAMDETGQPAGFFQIISREQVA